MQRSEVADFLEDLVRFLFVPCEINIVRELVWQSARGSYAFGLDTHLFAEGTVVMDGLALAQGVGGPPFVFNIGIQHAL